MQTEPKNRQTKLKNELKVQKLQLVLVRLKDGAFWSFLNIIKWNLLKKFII
jgi:hypothetical protein